jgi:Pectate lyase superfamily protein
MPLMPGTPRVDPRAWANVLDYGAIGNGTADDTLAIQAAVNATPNGGTVFFPVGHYKITAQIVLRTATHIVGSGKGYFGEPQYGTYIDAAGLPADVAAFWAPGNARNLVFRSFSLLGPTIDGGHGTMAFAAYFASYMRFENLNVYGFSYGLYAQYWQETSIKDCHISGASVCAFYAEGCTTIQVFCTVFANSGGTLVEGGGNVRLTAGTNSVIFDSPLQDETDANGFWCEACSSVIFRATNMFHARGGNTIRIGPTSSNITIYDTHLGPFSPDRVPLRSIYIEAGAQNVRLINVSTNPNGGGDIVDNATGTLYVNVNGRTRHPVVPTASLPAAGVLEDGRILIEDGGAGNRNLVFYAGGQRFRVDGGASV